MALDSVQQHMTPPTQPARWEVPASDPQAVAEGFLWVPPRPLDIEGATVSLALLWTTETGLEIDIVGVEPGPEGYPREVMRAVSQVCDEAGDPETVWKYLGRP